MKTREVLHWPTELLDAVIKAEEIAARTLIESVFTHLIDVDYPSSTSLGSVDFQANKLKMIESEMIMKWEAKRVYFTQLIEFGLMVNVELIDGYNNSHIELLPFAAYISKIDRLGHEIDKMKWYPTNFSSSQEFDVYKTEKLIESGLLERDLVAA